MTSLTIRTYNGMQTSHLGWEDLRLHWWGMNCLTDYILNQYDNLNYDSDGDITLDEVDFYYEGITVIGHYPLNDDDDVEIEITFKPDMPGYQKTLWFFTADTDEIY